MPGAEKRCSEGKSGGGMHRREMGAREAGDARIYTRLCIRRSLRRAPVRRERRSERAKHSPNPERAPALTESPRSACPRRRSACKKVTDRSSRSPHEPATDVSAARGRGARGGSASAGFSGRSEACRMDTNDRGGQTAAVAWRGCASRRGGLAEIGPAGTVQATTRTI